MKYEEEKIKKKNPLKWIIIVGNIILALILLIAFAMSKKEEFVKPLLTWEGTILGIQFVIFLIYSGIKKSKRNKAKEEPQQFFTQKSENTVDDARENAWDYMWEKEGIKEEQSYTLLSEPRAVKLDTGTTILAYILLVKELISPYKRTYLFVSLVNDPTIKGHRIMKEEPKEDDIMKYAKQIARQPTEIKHSITTRTDPQGNIITEEQHEPIIPQIELIKPKEVGKL